MATAGTDTLDIAPLLDLLGPQLTAEQATLIFQQGQEAVVFALLTLAKRLAEKPPIASTTPDPSTPSGQIPPYTKPTGKGRAKPKGAKQGHPGHRRPAPSQIDRREEHTLSDCPKCHGPVRPCRGSRTRVIEDIPADITPVVTEHTIRRYWCPKCRDTVESVVPDALPGSTIGLRVVVLSAWLHYLLGTTLAQIIDVFNFHLHFKLSAGGLVQMWRRLREILLAWYLEIQTQALNRAVPHADETGWRVEGETYWSWCFTTQDLTYYMIDRSRGSPALKKFFKKTFAGVLVTDFWGAYNAVVCAETEVPAALVARSEADPALSQTRGGLAGVLPATEAADARLDPPERAAEGTVREGVHIAAAAAGRAVARTAGAALGAASCAPLGEATAAACLRVVHLPGPYRSPVRQQPRGASDPPGGDRAEEQLCQRKRGWCRDPGRPDERLPHAEATRSQPRLGRTASRP
jgi:hypothetical protein